MSPDGSLRPEIKSTLVVEIHDSLQKSPVSPFLQGKMVELLPVPQDWGCGDASTLSPDTTQLTPSAVMHQRVRC